MPFLSNGDRDGEGTLALRYKVTTRPVQILSKRCFDRYNIAMRAHSHSPINVAIKSARSDVIDHSVQERQAERASLLYARLDTLNDLQSTRSGIKLYIMIPERALSARSLRHSYRGDVEARPS